ncbi:hypothetical protein BDR05DRAFT_964194 [Suillus weaverae]|nr:hypothetical protein BDR05DRAFT_964194 [Suillus weaverae]
MTEPAPTKHDIPSDFTVTSQISEKLKHAHPCASGSFGDVYHFTIKTSKDTMEVCLTNLSELINHHIYQVAVKVLKVDPGRAIEKIEKAMHRELDVVRS